MTQYIKDVSRFKELCKVVRTKMQQIHHVKGCKYLNQANNYKHSPLTINPKLEITCGIHQIQVPSCWFFVPKT